MKRKPLFIKLNEDDILEILLEHYQDQGYEFGKGLILGSPGNGLRFIGALGPYSNKSLVECDLIQVDESMDFNGSHPIDRP